MTFLARDARMLAGERVLALRMIIPRRVLPATDVMTSRARALEAAAVRVGVAAQAVALESYPAGARLPLRERRRLRNAKLRLVAGAALHRGVTLFEDVSRSAVVIEPFGRPVWPLNELKVATRVIRMAARARPSSGAARMKATGLLAQPADLAMTGQAALRGRLVPPAVTRRAPQTAVERCVRPRERTWRDLRVSAKRHDRQCHHDAEQCGREGCVNSRWPPPASEAAPWSRTERRSARGA